MVDAKFHQEHFDLYQRYIASRHAGGGMENPDQASYMDFLTASWADTAFIEMRHDKQLLAIAVVDFLNDGLSAVYTFFDPSAHKRSLGRFAILHEIEKTNELGLKWLYLGYWIEECQKMAYKSEYLPHERLVNGKWHPYERTE